MTKAEGNQVTLERQEISNISDKNHVKKPANYFDFDIEGNEWEWQHQQHGEKGNDVQKHSEDIPQHDQDTHVFDEAIHPVYGEDLQQHTEDVHLYNEDVQQHSEDFQPHSEDCHLYNEDPQQHDEDTHLHSEDVQQHSEEFQQHNTYSHAQHKQYDSQQDQQLYDITAEGAGHISSLLKRLAESQQTHVAKGGSLCGTIP